MSANKKQPAQRSVIFEITTLRPLPVGQQVFISGSAPGLGLWRAEGFPLARADENRWTGTAILPAAEPVEYKVTRGVWTTEEVDADGRLLPNAIVAPGASSAQRTVVRWRDEGR